MERRCHWALVDGLDHENHVVAGELLQNLLERGLRVEGPMLFVIDGGKGIHKGAAPGLRRSGRDPALPGAISSATCATISSETRRAYVGRQMREAYKSKSASVAKKKLLQLAHRGSTPMARMAPQPVCAKVLDETLTVLRLGLPPTLCRTFSTTNAIENMLGTLRRICRNVKRWRGQKMIRRWIALGIAEAQKRFRRVKGHQQMPALVAHASGSDEQRPPPWRKKKTKAA